MRSLLFIFMVIFGLNALADLPSIDPYVKQAQDLFIKAKATTPQHLSSSGFLHITLYCKLLDARKGGENTADHPGEVIFSIENGKLVATSKISGNKWSVPLKADTDGNMYYQEKVRYGAWDYFYDTRMDFRISENSSLMIIEFSDDTTTVPKGWWGIREPAIGEPKFNVGYYAICSK